MQSCTFVSLLTDDLWKQIVAHLRKEDCLFLFVNAAPFFELNRSYWTTATMASEKFSCVIRTITLRLFPLIRDNPDVVIDHSLDCEKELSLFFEEAETASFFRAYYLLRRA